MVNNRKNALRFVYVRRQNLNTHTLAFSDIFHDFIGIVSF